MTAAGNISSQEQRGLIDLDAALRESNIQESLDELDRELVGLRPVKTRIRGIASLLLVEKLRKEAGLAAEPPTLHMSFSGRPGTGKTTVAMRMAMIPHRLGYVRKGHVVVATLDELMEIAELMLGKQMYRFDDQSRAAFVEYLKRRIEQPHFSNARSVRNAIDRIRLRQANRLVRAGGSIARDELSRIDEADVRQSRVFDIQ